MHGDVPQHPFYGLRNIGLTKSVKRLHFSHLTKKMACWDAVQKPWEMHLLYNCIVVDAARIQWFCIVANKQTISAALVLETSSFWMPDIPYLGFKGIWSRRENVYDIEYPLPWK